MGKLKNFGRFWKDVFAEWSEDNASTWAAALALYTVLSLGPLLLLVVSLLGLILGQNVAQSQIVDNSRGIIGDQGGQAIANILQNAHAPGNGITGAIIGFLVLLFGVAGLFLQLQTSLNTMWEVEPKPGQGIMGLLRRRLSSFVSMAGMLLLLLVLLIASAGVTSLTGSFTQGSAAILIQELTCDPVHVGDEEQESLARRETGGARAGL